MRERVALILAVAGVLVLLALIVNEFIHPTDVSSLGPDHRFEFEMAIIDAKRDLLSIVFTGLIAYLMARRGKGDD